MFFKIPNRHPNWKEVKLPVFTDDICDRLIIYPKKSKESIKKTIKANTQIYQSSRYKINTQKSAISIHYQ